MATISIDSLLSVVHQFVNVLSARIELAWYCYFPAASETTVSTNSTTGAVCRNLSGKVL